MASSRSHSRSPSLSQAIIRINNDDQNSTSSRISTSSPQRSDHGLDQFARGRYLTVPGQGEVIISRRGLSTSRERDSHLHSRSRSHSHRSSHDGNHHRHHHDTDTDTDSNSDNESDFENNHRSRRYLTHHDNRSHSATSLARRPTSSSSSSPTSSSSSPRSRPPSFIDKHFDASPSGLIATVAGAAIGSFTATRFGRPANKGIQAISGAVLGAAALNAAENRYRGVREDREMGVRRERRWEDMSPARTKDRVRY